jgi:hypothetical protein
MSSKRTGSGNQRQVMLPNESNLTIYETEPDLLVKFCRFSSSNYHHFRVTGASSIRKNGLETENVVRWRRSAELTQKWCQLDKQCLQKTNSKTGWPVFLSSGRDLPRQDHTIFELSTPFHFEERKRTGSRNLE